jgi:hypothetical protein
VTSKLYGLRGYVIHCTLAAVLVGGSVAYAQAPSGASRQTCAALLADDGGQATDAPSISSDTTRVRSDSVAVSVGGARTGAPDIILLAQVQADEVRFASQPRVRVRLCWGGDTLRVVQRENLPSPVVAGTTYRNVYVAVELLGRLNAECLVDRIATGRTITVNARMADSAGLGSCAFLGARAEGGQQPARPPSR